MDDKEKQSKEDAASSSYETTSNDFLAAAEELIAKSGAEKIFELQEKYSIDRISQSESVISGISFDESDRIKLEAESSIFEKPVTGLSKNFATLYIITAFCGNGVTYMPYAMKLSGFAGYLLFSLVGVNSLYCSLLIGWCRIIIQEQWPEYKENIPSPYPRIGLKAVGKWMEVFVTIVMNLAIIIWCTVLLSNMANMLYESFPRNITICMMMLLVAAFLIFLSVLDSLKELWIIVLANALITVLFSSLLTFAVVIDKERIGLVHYTEKFEASEFASAFGLITFIVSSGGTYPSIHDEMLNRRLYSQSVIMGHIGVAVMFAPLPLIGYAAYGTGVYPNVLRNLRENEDLEYLVIFIQLIFTLKMVATFLVALNPLFKNMESHLKIPPKFGFRKCIFRIIVVVVVTLFGLLFSQNILILEAVGAALLNILAFQFPVIFYICLVLRGTSSKKRERTISKKEWCLLIEILLISNIGGIAAALKDVITIGKIDWLLQQNCYKSFLTITNRSCVFC